VLFINNIYPEFCAPNEGCFFWGWYILCDMQLALIIPIFVLVYTKSKAAGHVLVLFTSIANTFQILYTINSYKLRVGVLAYENWYLFAYALQKPWCHIASVMVGVMSGQFYMTVLEYREKSDEEKKTYKIIHAGYTSYCWKAVLVVGGLGIILCDLLTAHTAI
jgi:hypothetical protein